MTARRETVDPSLRLRRILAEAEWSTEALASAVNAMGARQGLRLTYDRADVARWLAGARPRPPVPQLICQALSYRLGRHVTPAHVGLAAAAEAAAGPAPPADPVAWLADLASGDSDPARRASRRALVFDPAAVPPPWPDAPATTSPPATSAASRRAEVTALTRMVSLHAYHLDAFGGGGGRAMLAAYLAEDVTRWLRASPRPELLTPAAQLAQLLSHSCADAGHEGMAQRYLHAALGLAAAAGNRVMYVTALRAASAQAHRVGEVGLALRLAEGAWAAAPRATPPAVAAYVLAQLAVARARAGLRVGALRALARAERHLDHVEHVARAGRVDRGTGVDHGDRPGRGAWVDGGGGHLDRVGRGSDEAGGPFQDYPLADFAYQQGQALAALGEGEAAVEALQRSLATRAAHRRRPQALTLARTAELQLRRGHLEEACAHWDALLAHLGRAPGLDSAQVRASLAHMRRELAPHRSHPVASALLDRTAALRLREGR